LLSYLAIKNLEVIDREVSVGFCGDECEPVAVLGIVRVVAGGECAEASGRPCLGGFAVDVFL